MAQWSQLGMDIDGAAAGDQAGFFVSTSADGNRVAIGSPFHNGNGSDAGQVRIYDWNGTMWTQVGADIDGEAADDQSGKSISMSASGSRVAIGAIGNDGNGSNAGHVRIYDLIAGSWTQVGADIDGEAMGDESFSVSMSADGSRVAIGALRNGGSGTDAGHVRIYDWNGTMWNQVGADIDGEAAGDFSGFSTSLSADGNRVAIGANRNDGIGIDAGHVRVYDWTGAMWTQVGGDIDGEAADDQSARSIAMSADGSRVIVGARLNDGTGSNAGHVRVYDWNGTVWGQVGADIDGEATGDESGYSVSMSADGNRVAIGAQLNDGTGFNAGHVRIYHWNGTLWAQSGADIDGEAANDESGYAVSMSADGRRVVVGARLNDGTGSTAGHARIYGIQAQCPPSNLTFSTQAQIDDFSFLYPTCTMLSGITTIEGSDITNLDSLIQITAYTRLIIESNPMLNDLSGLDALEYIEFGLDFNLNNGLTSIPNINALDSMGDLATLAIAFNPNLTSITGFNSLTKMGGLTLLATPLTNISGLSSLTTGSIRVEATELEDIYALSNIDTSTITNLILLNNDSLSICDASNICNYLSDPANPATISGNAPGCADRAEVDVSSLASCLPGGIHFSTQAQIDSFPINYPGCSQIQGYVKIRGMNITSLDSLIQIKTIGGYLEIYDNDSLAQLTGLDSLTHVEGLVAISSKILGLTPSILGDLTGLGSLSSIGDRLLLESDYELGLDLTGMESLISVGGILEIRGGYFPTGLTSLYNLSSVSGALKLENSNLNGWGLEGLDNLNPDLLSDIIFDNMFFPMTYCAVPSICDYLSDPSNTITFVGSNPHPEGGQWTRARILADCAVGSFITTWKTDNPGVTGSNQIRIPTGDGLFNYDVDWGDGSSSFHEGDAQHTYAFPGTYTVEIRGAFPHIQFNNGGDRQKLLTIEQWGKRPWGSMNQSFYGCENLVLNAIDMPALRRVTDMSGMFRGCTNVNHDISGWNVGAVTDMNNMFRETGFNQDIGDWDVSQVTDMSNMFFGAVELSIVNYDSLLIGWASLDSLQQNVTFTADSSHYCAGDSARQQIIDTYGWTIDDSGRECYFTTTWKTDNPGPSDDNTIVIPTGAGTFSYAVFWGDGTSSVHTGSAAHTYASPGTYTVAIEGDFPHIQFGFGNDGDKLISIDRWGAQVWMSMNASFAGCDSLELNAIDAPDLSQVTDMSQMFAGTTVNGDFNHWDVSNVELMWALFLYNTEFNGSISNWDVSNVTDMYVMFFEASMFNGDISSWDVGNVSNMQLMFGSATSFDQNIGGWDVSQVVNMSSMFSGATSFNQNLGNWDVSQVTNMSSMFANTGLSTTHYDSLLMGWASLDSLQMGVSFDAGFSEYCQGASARQNIIDDYSWMISDSGQVCPFITTWKTDNPGSSDMNSISIPTGSGTFDYTVDWGDESISMHTGPASHTYASPGTYTVSIKGDFPHLQFNNGGDREKILSVEQWGNHVWTSMNGSFYGCPHLTLNADDSPDLSSVSNMTNMFRNATMVNSDISEWDVSNVTNMGTMFALATSFDQNVGDWDVSNVSDMSNMFIGATLSVNNYDSLLIGWANLPSLQTGQFFHGGNSQYCAGADARQDIITNHSWIFTDGGPASGIVNTWIGTSTGDWHDAANWSTGIPNSCDEVVIPAGADVTIYNGRSASCNTIDVETGAILSMELGGTLDIQEP